MEAISSYQSPLGELLLTADETGLTGVWFPGQKYFAENRNRPVSDQSSEICDEAASMQRAEAKGGSSLVLEQTKQWLTVYFSGQEPDFMPPLHMIGTPFQLSVWKLLQKIPYGETTTYGEIAAEIAAQKGIPRMSAQAVGGAVGHNPVGILVPCHRVVGSNGSLTGYAGGLDKKRKLLTLEKVNMDRFFVPKKGTAR